MSGLLRHPDPLTLHPVHEQRSSARRISASFDTDEPLSCQPSVATSALTASKIPTSHTMDALPSLPPLPTLPTMAPRIPRKVTPTNLSLPKPSIVTTYTTAVVPPHCPYNDENIAPSTWVESLASKHRDSIGLASTKLRARSKSQHPAAISKSSTLSVITNLTASLSRTSLSKFSLSASVSSMAESEARISIASDASAGSSNDDTTGGLKIYSAQSSAYWTGRFVALQDRFRNEMLLPENMTTLVTAHAERSVVPDEEPGTRAARMAAMYAPKQNTASARPKPKRHSTTNKARETKTKTRVAGSSLDAARLEDEDDRARRIFLYLEALCATSEAKRSLHVWQQKYARRMGKENLLPRGGTMDGKGWVGRLLGRGSYEGRNGVNYTGIV